MVLKVLDLSDKSAEWREKFTGVQVDALQRLQHDNLIRTYKAFLDPSESWWFVEYDLYHCNLAAAVRKHDGKCLPEERGKIWCQQIVSALSYLHENHWPHRDLKMENILVSSDDSVVIADFAFTFEQKNGTPNPESGSLTYAAPELLMTDTSRCNPFKADIWALGIIFFSMHSDSRLFREETDIKVLQAEHNLLTFRIYEVPFSFFLKSLLTKMMAVNPEQRIDAKDIPVHAWFTGKTGGMDSISFDPQILQKKGYLDPHVIGSGSFATVYECRTKKEASAKVAVKYINLSTASDQFLDKLFVHERRALMRLKHKYLVPIIEIFSDKQEIQWFIVMPLCPSTLKAEAKKFTGRRIPENVGRVWANQVVQALKYLHDYHWVHRDLKMDNVMMNVANDALLGDFTFARQQVRGSLSETRCGSIRYMAPELTKAGPYDGFLSDIWSMGSLIYCMHAGDPPVKEKKSLINIWKEQREVAITIQEQKFSASLADLLTKMMHFSATERLPLKQVLSHAWFTQKTPVGGGSGPSSHHRTRSESAPASLPHQHHQEPHQQHHDEPHISSASSSSSSSASAHHPDVSRGRKRSTTDAPTAGKR